MATGSGTGTPATGTSTPTLATLRARLRTQLENASGQTEPLHVNASAETLTTLTDRIEALLQDSGNARWSTADVAEAIEQIIEQYSNYKPDHAIGTIALSADGREISLSSLTNLVRVEKVWWDYDSTTPGYPPNWRQFEVWPGKILYIDDTTAPSNGDTVRIWYTKLHTLNGLNSETVTSIPQEDIASIIAGAAAIACQMRIAEISEDVPTNPDEIKHLTAWAEEQHKIFRKGTYQDLRAWQRRAYAYDQSDLDEAIRWALGRYNEINPDETITSLTLSEDGREIDVSSITDYLRFTRAWWPYTSTDPEYNPRWRDFELWPGNVLFLDTSDEPQSGDVVRVWYNRLRTINGLDGASTTTIDADAETLILVGAVGFAAQERIQEQPGIRVPRKLQEWAQARLKEFERGLSALGRRLASQHSGIATAAPLDRWESRGDHW